jgi:UDP-3-O-[3-hydroxymyristoyl] glucosamine N-acyltransferase
VAIHAGSVIGEDGLGYAPVDGQWVKIPQVGHVEVADDVEIGANCTIDRATLGKTIVGKGTKFSNLIAVGHGTKIGEACMLVAQVGLAGSVVVGDRVTMAGQAGVVGHITIGDNATLAAKAGVTNDVAPGVTVLGQPAVPIAECKRQVASLHRLPEMRRKLRELEAEVEELRQRLDAAGA